MRIRFMAEPFSLYRCTLFLLCHNLILNPVVGLFFDGHGRDDQTHFELPAWNQGNCPSDASHDQGEPEQLHSDPPDGKRKSFECVQHFRNQVDAHRDE